ncbi:MAG: CHAT domain-containing protein [Polyangiaceae bacterium]
MPSVAACEVELDGTPAAFESQQVGGGLAIDVKPRTARVLGVQSPQGRWELKLEPTREPAALVVARSARARGAPDEARRTLHAASSSAPPSDRPRLLAALARLDLADGNVPLAEQRLVEAIAAAEGGDRISDLGSDMLALAYLLATRSFRLDAARKWLHRVRALASEHPDLHARLPYYTGLIDVESGDLRAALARFRESELQALRLNLTTLLADSREQQAITLAVLGRGDDALQLQRALALELRSAPACKRLNTLANLAWIELSAAQPSAAKASADGAVNAHETACQDPYARKNARLTAAASALALGLAAPAAAHLKRARSIDVSGASLRLWQLDLEGQLAMLQGRDREALERFEREEEMARRLGAPDALWRALTQRARSSAKVGEFELALRAARDAEATLESSLPATPLFEGRDAFLSQRDTSARILVDFLVRAGKPEEAFAVARAARSRIPRALAGAERLAGLSPSRKRLRDQAIGRYRKARERLETLAAKEWELSMLDLAKSRSDRGQLLNELREALDAVMALEAADARGDETSQVAEDEVVLCPFPVPDGWVAFVHTSAGLRAVRIPAPDFSQQSTAAAMFLEPIRHALPGKARLRVLPYAETWQLDLHAALVDGAALIAKVAVSYGLGLGSPSDVDTGDSSLLVVANPQGDLRHTESEADAVAKAWRNGPVRRLQREEARRDDVLRQLRVADAFHFAGHGVFAGPSGGDSALLLAKDEELRLSDILTLERVPRNVVLSACDAARTSAAAPGSFGLAQAFLVRGATSVVAPTRPVSDHVAAALMKHVYSTRGLPLPEALRRAQTALLTQIGGADVVAYRALVP